MQQYPEVFNIVFKTYDQAVKIEEPAQHPFNFSAEFVTTQWQHFLRRSNAVVFVGRNHFDAVTFHNALIQAVAFMYLNSGLPSNICFNSSLSCRIWHSRCEKPTSCVCTDSADCTMIRIICSRCWIDISTFVLNSTYRGYSDVAIVSRQIRR